jgi:hypothetical protein
MAMPLLGESCAFELKFSPAAVGVFVDKDPSTVKRWFSGLPGVRSFPRGYGAQKPSLEIPESVVRKKLQEIGYTAEEIETGLIVPFRRRLELERAVVAQNEPVAPKRKRGRPPKATKPFEPPPGKATAHKRRR